MAFWRFYLFPWTWKFYSWHMTVQDKLCVPLHLWISLGGIRRMISSCYSGLEVEPTATFTWFELVFFFFFFSRHETTQQSKSCFSERFRTNWAKIDLRRAHQGLNLDVPWSLEKILLTRPVRGPRILTFAFEISHLQTRFKHDHQIELWAATCGVACGVQNVQIVVKFGRCSIFQRCLQMVTMLTPWFVCGHWVPSARPQLHWFWQAFGEPSQVKWDPPPPAQYSISGTDTTLMPSHDSCHLTGQTSRCYPEKCNFVLFHSIIITQPSLKRLTDRRPELHRLTRVGEFLVPIVSDSCSTGD